jgi:hypothetical protein
VVTSAAALRNGTAGAFAAERPGQAAGAAWKNVDARKTKNGGPVSFSRWLGGLTK